MDPGPGAARARGTPMPPQQQPYPVMNTAMNMNMGMVNGRAGSPPSHPGMMQPQQHFMQQQQQRQQHVLPPQLQQQQQHQPHPQMQSLPPHIQAQMMAAMANASGANGGFSSSPSTPPVQTPPSGGFVRSPSVAGGMKGPIMSEEQKRNIQFNPAQLQAFMQAQAQAQAQMQAQTQATAAAQQQQQQQPRPLLGQGPIPQQQQQPIMQQPPQQQFLPQGALPQLPFNPLAASNGPNGMLGTPPPQMPRQPFPIAPTTMSGTPITTALRSDPTAANAVAGPSNLNAANASLQLQQQQQQMRRPSMDQITLMQRLSQLAQKPGGLPIQSLFTKTSWESSNTPAETEGDQQGGSSNLPMPEFTPLERRNLEGWMKKDIRNLELGLKEKNRMRDTLEEMAQDMLTAQDWLGPPRMTTGTEQQQQQEGKLRIRSRKEMEKELGKGKRKTRPWLEFTKKQLREVARVEECLVPIRLDIEHDGRKLCDTLTWNLNDTLITPSIFASILCEDLLLPSDPFHNSIVTSIKEQIKQYQEAEESHPRTLFMRAPADAQVPLPSPSPLAEQALDPFSSSSAAAMRQMDAMQGDLIEDEEDWWDGWRKKVKLAQEVEVGQEMTGIPWSTDESGPDIHDASQEAPLVQVHPPDPSAVQTSTPAPANDELRILIQLDISVDTINLKDQFEWDMADPQNSPEEFAAIYCADLGLPGEFRTAIVHLIREQADAYARSLSSIRHIKGDQVLHDELRPAFQPPLVDVIRSTDIEAWTPHLEKLGLVELEHREKERERQSRRQKRGARNNRRNVVTLPDRDPLKTNRTIMPRAGAKLEVPDPNNAGDEAAVASYQTSEPFPLQPTKNMGPPPKMASPLRRYAKPQGMAVNGDSAINALAGGLGVKGKKKGRLPNQNQEIGTLAGDAGSPPPFGASTVTASPAPPPVQQKKPPTKPMKGRPGWSRTEMTTHENVIDGKWHCTNCGVPEPVAVGRRKGPAGPNTQCAECSKYWQANKGKLRPCEYTTDPAYHVARTQGFHPSMSHSRGASIASTPAPTNLDSPGSGFDNESGDEYKPDVDSSFMTESGQTGGRPRGDSDASLFASQNRPGPPPSQALMGGKHLGGKQLPPPPVFNERPTQPRPPSYSKQQQQVSNQLPNAPPQQPFQQQQKPKSNLQPPQQQQQSLPTIRLSPNRVHAQIPSASSSPASGDAQGLARPSAPPRKRPEPPSWLLEQMAKLRQDKPDDRFEITNKPRTTPNEPIEFRVKCLDCPGKIYKPGPDETLDNFAGHLRFKGHRSAVAARMAGGPPV